MKQPVAILNEDHREYVEQYQGVTYRIPAGKAIVMSRRDAVMFLGNYSGTDPDNAPHPRPKVLKIRPIDECQGLIVSQYEDRRPEQKPVYVCNYDGKSFPTQEALDEHLKIHAPHTIKPTKPAGLEEPEELKGLHDLVPCPFCGKDVKGRMGMMSHLRVCPKAKGDSPEESIDDAERSADVPEVTVS